MRIAIDARTWSWEGIGRYTRNLLRELTQQPDQHEYIGLVSVSDLKAAEQMRLSLPESARSRLSWQVVEGSYYSWREQILFRRQLERIPADLFHFTHFNVPLGFKRPYVITIHDITRFYFPGQNRQKLLQQIAYELVFKKAVKGALGVIAVSQSTADELKTLTVRVPKVQVVITEGVDPDFYNRVTVKNRRKVRMLLGGNFPYVLFVGVWMSHKNLVRLVQAFALVHKEFPQVKLVITGRPKPGYSSILKTVRKYTDEDEVVLPGFVSAELLPALYAEAACFAFPSLYEGFGLPILEAAVVKTPVVTSNVTSMPELLGNAAEYVNPESIIDIARGIKHALGGGAEIEARVEEAQKKASEFKWEEAAAAHVKTYERVMTK